MQESVARGRIDNPVMVVPGALQPLLELANSAREVGLSPRTADLVHLRAAQINGCSYCVDMHARDLKKAGETDERLFAVAAWRETPYFSDAERAALALSEAASLTGRIRFPTRSTRRPLGTTTSRRLRP